MRLSLQIDALGCVSRYCATSTSTTGHWDTLQQPPTVRQLETFMKGLTADDCLPDMEEELSGIDENMKLT